MLGLGYCSRHDCRVEVGACVFVGAALAQVAGQQQQQQTVSIIYPSASLTYVDHWPDGVALSLFCATSPQWSTLPFHWLKNGLTLASSDRWRFHWLKNGLTLASSDRWRYALK